MPISNVSGSNFTTLYSSQGNANRYVPIPPSNANVSGQNYTTLYSAGSGTAPVPIAPYGNANVESFLAVGSDTGGNTVGNLFALRCGHRFSDALKKNFVVVLFNNCGQNAANIVARSNAPWHVQLSNF